MCMHMSPRAMRAACNRGRVEADFPNSSGALGRGRQREEGVNHCEEEGVNHCEGEGVNRCEERTASSVRPGRRG